MSYLQILLQPRPAGRSTDIWRVQSTSGRYLGTISWYSHWRQYAFYPSESTIFNHDCLVEIATFCWEQTVAHRAALHSGKSGLRTRMEDHIVGQP